MNTENGAIKVTVLLEHHEGDKRWSASVPLVENCIVEGLTPEEAAKAVIPVIEDFTKDDPNLLDNLKEEPEFLLAQINFKPSDIQGIPNPDPDLKPI